MNVLFFYANNIEKYAHFVNTQCVTIVHIIFVLFAIKYSVTIAISSEKRKVVRSVELCVPFVKKIIASTIIYVFTVKVSPVWNVNLNVMSVLLFCVKIARKRGVIMVGEKNVTLTIVIISVKNTKSHSIFVKIVYRNSIFPKMDTNLKCILCYNTFPYENGHDCVVCEKFHCNKCKKTCPFCERFFCLGGGVLSCDVCKTKICWNCCERCECEGTFMCINRHEKIKTYCEKCKNLVCYECKLFCEFCGVKICQNCVKYYSPNKCYSCCVLCSKCGGDKYFNVDPCTVCDDIVCENCSIECIVCNKNYCNDHLDRNVCPKCLSRIS